MRWQMAGLAVASTSVWCSKCRRKAGFFAAAWCALIFVGERVLFPNNGEMTDSTLPDDDDVYSSTHMCDATTGRCGEDPAIPSPRTVYSAKSRQQYKQWWEFQSKLLEKAKAYSFPSDHPAPLLLLGDSITESWLGTNMGDPDKRCAGIPQVLRARFTGGSADPLVLAIGGDQTQHLLYRLQKGELTTKTKAAENAVFVVLIGTNNIGSGHLPDDTVRGIVAVAEYILEVTAGRVVIQLLLPRGDTYKVARLCPPRCSHDGTPFESFMPAIDKVNDAVATRIPDLRAKYGSDRLSLVDCGHPFLSTNEKDEVNVALMPDRLHPNAAGHELLATCLLDCIERGRCITV